MLQLSDIRFSYTSKPPWAVDGVSLSLNRGEVFGLLGPNGAGKSTLMALISGLRRPQSGRIERAADVEERGGFVLVPQDHAFYPMLTCRENLRYFAGVLGITGPRAKERIDVALATTGLEAVADRRAQRCSGGLKRRLNLAIGLVGDPKLLLLDEPTVGVDPQSRAFLLKTVRDLQAAGKTIVYTSHYMEEVQQVSDRVGIIDHGRLLCSGTLGELLAEGVCSVRVGVAAEPGTSLRKMLQAEFGFVAGESDAKSLRFDLPRSRPVDELLRTLREAGCPVSSVQHGCSHLEDLFLKLTHRHLRDD